MNWNFYAGIGSRETPAAVLREMTYIAAEMESTGWILRSGGADGADSAFEHGATQNRARIYLPWYGYNDRNSKQCVIPPADKMRVLEDIAARHHPAWDRCRQGARKLHARNVAILLGLNQDIPCKLVVCWTRLGQATGGTGMGIRIAEAHSIPIMNLYDHSTDDVLRCARKLSDRQSNI